jgi:DNA-binding transcriptional MerR regulator
MGYTLEQIEAVAQKLREMPEADPSKRIFSKQETVRLLSGEITELRKRGYTLEQISESLRGEGIDITTPTLKNYLQRVKARARGSKSGTKTRREKPKTPMDAPKKADSAEATFTPKPDSDDI